MNARLAWHPNMDVGKEDVRPPPSDEGLWPRAIYVVVQHMLTYLPIQDSIEPDFGCNVMMMRRRRVNILSKKPE